MPVTEVLANPEDISDCRFCPNAEHFSVGMYEDAVNHILHQAYEAVKSK